MSATVVTVAKVSQSTTTPSAPTPTSAATSMSVDTAGEPVLLQVHNADSTHALTVELAAGAGPSAPSVPLDYTIAANSTKYIALPNSGSYADATGLIQLTLTPVSGGALTSSTVVGFVVTS